MSPAAKWAPRFAVHELTKTVGVQRSKVASLQTLMYNLMKVKVNSELLSHVVISPLLNDSQK